MGRLRLFLVLHLAFMIPPGISPAWSGDRPARPRIGLAFQGGGAKGFAHIGVLQWLEENRIPADLIAGTSMGGLIGGFYAAGRSTAELKELVHTLNWDELIGGQPPFRLLSFRRKEDRLTYPNRLDFGLRRGFGLPSGLNSGHEIGLILDRAALPYYNLESFEDLPIPFRCVAVDLISGRQVVFSRGSLSDALRATMSLPAVFSPLRRDGAIYVDGGLLNNLPVDVAKDMGADLVIAVNLDIGDYDPKDAATMVGVLGRSIDVMIGSEVARSLRLADLVIHVDVKEFTTLDFSASDAIIRKGYEAAAAMSAELSKYALPEEEWERYLTDRESRKRTEVPVPQFVDVEGVLPSLGDPIKEDLRDFIARPLDAGRLEERLDGIWGEGRYAALGYGFVERGGRPGLLIRPEEKEHSPPILNLNLNIDGSDVGLIRFGVGARLTMLDLWGYRSEWRTDVNVGTVNLIASEYYRAVARNPHWFVAPRAYAGNSLLDIYSYGERTAEYRASRIGFGADLGFRFSRATELRFGQDLAWYAARLRSGKAPIEDYSHRVAVSNLQFRYYGQDDAIVPRRGMQIETRGEWFTSRPEQAGGFPRAEAKITWFRPVSRPGSVFASAAGGTAFGRDGLGLLAFSLGGILRLGSYGENELLGNQYYLLTAGYLHEVASFPTLIGGQIYAGGWYQLGKMYGSPELPRYPMDVSGGLLIKTLLGPLFLGGSWGDSGHHKLYFGLGAIF